MRDRAPPSLKRNQVIPSETKRTATAFIRLDMSEVEAEDKAQLPLMSAPAESI